VIEIFSVVGVKAMMMAPSSLRQIYFCGGSRCGFELNLPIVPVLNSLPDRTKVWLAILSAALAATHTTRTTCHHTFKDEEITQLRVTLL